MPLGHGHGGAALCWADVGQQSELAVLTDEQQTSGRSVAADFSFWQDFTVQRRVVDPRLP